MTKQKAGASGNERKGRRLRSNDDLQLIKLILDENEALRERVLRLLHRTLNKTPEK